MEETDLAAEEFRQCISLTADDALKARAYTMLSRLYEEQGDRGKERDILLEARAKLFSLLAKTHLLLAPPHLIQSEFTHAPGTSSGRSQIG